MSAIAEKGKTHSTELIIFPIFLLIIVGVIANNMSASGIQTTPIFITSTNYPVGIVVPNDENGCDASIQNCNLTAISAFSFLNPNSPFTFLIEGNVLGFMSNLLSNGETANTFNTGDTLCIPVNPFGQLQNQSGSQITGFQCYGRVSDSSNVQPPSIIPVINASSYNGNASIWNLEGCPNTNPPKSNPACGIFYTGPNAQWAQLTENAFYIKNGTQLTTGSCTVGGVTYSNCGAFWKIFFGGGTATFTCPNTATLHAFGTNKTIFINATTYYCLIPFNAQNQVNFSSTLGFWAFIGGIILLVIGMGISLGTEVVGTGFTFGSNEQGSRTATILAIFILIWSFIYSEFSNWLTNFATLGLGTIIFLVLAATSFIGIYWRMFSLD